MTNVFFDGKGYEVPGDLTIMTAMEYAGFRLVRGCGCRHGFCGACGTIYRIAERRSYREKIRLQNNCKREGAGAVKLILRRH